MKEFKGIVKNITQQVIVDGITYTTPVYDVEYTCYFNDEGTFLRLICDKHDGVVTIPHIDIYRMCTGSHFERIISEAYPDKELIHLVCEIFFRQYNELDAWGTPRVLEMCGFDVHSWFVGQSNFDQLLSKYDYYFFDYGDTILKLTPDCKDKLIGRKVHLIRRKQ